jgi:hypothetical protein
MLYFGSLVRPPLLRYFGLVPLLCYFGLVSTAPSAPAPSAISVYEPLSYSCMRAVFRRRLCRYTSPILILLVHELLLYEVRA